ncbi:MAG: hypothetical protein OD817_08240 [Gammaproteobacteria bacterium]
MKVQTPLSKDPFYLLLLENTEKMSAREYLKALEHPEEIDLSETKFVMSSFDEPDIGHFLVKWRYPKYPSAKQIARMWEDR